ncbi:hypothetical protein GTH32_01985 [Alteromonas sp. 345S023]|uniref:PEP-CTERM sorting domain-containing protein n=1 Tax=Alteromonas profundi TaxID=2696062 RepID=A0A7X5LIF8_9ALTE|nr:hypothetical protein [Alteromonas profundi]NDV89966.1 hypothetical protein [Alteromonas profundi]
MLKNFFKVSLAVMALSSALPSSASVILSSDFTGTSGDPANVTWTENDVSVTNTLDPKDLSLSSLDLFTNSTNMFAVDHNIHKQGSWFVDILVSASSLIAGIDLDVLSLDASIYNKNGVLQPAQRDLSFSLELLDGLSSIFSDTVNVFAGDNNDPGFTPTETIEFDLSGIFLDGGDDYTFRLTVSGTGGGNNAGFDNLLLTGTSNSLTPLSVSAPGTLIILIMSLSMLIFRSRK